MTTAVLIIVLLAAAVLIVIVGGILFGIRTQHADRGVTVVRRRPRRRGRTREDGRR